MPGESKMTEPNLVYAKDSQFSKIYATIKKKLGPAKISKLCKSSPEERLQILSGIEEANFKVEAHGSIKDEAKALEFKEMGNQKFRENSFGEAFQLYTQALQHCPVFLDNPSHAFNKTYSIMWANRSAALDSVGLYTACIHDIEMALKFGYPREFWYKIYKRKGHAHIKMKQFLLAREALEISLKNIGRSDIKKEKDRDNYRMRVRKQMTVFNVTKTLYNVETYEKFDTVLADGQPQDTGLSGKLKIVEDGNKCELVAEKDVFQEENLAVLEPYVSVVNITGGRAGGKICPHSLEKMFSSIPCRFGSEELFESEKSRDEAAESYHQYEWKIRKNLETMGFQEKAKLALRMVTLLNPDDVATMTEILNNAKSSPDERLKIAADTFRLPVQDSSEEEELLSSVVGLYLMRNLAVSGFIKSPTGNSKLEVQVLQLLTRAMLVAIKHTSEIKLMNVPSEKKCILDTDIITDTCGYGIYPQLHNIKKHSSGESSDAIEWFCTKKMVFTSFRRVEAGSPVCLFTDQNKVKNGKEKPTDLITFRCGNGLCKNSFPLKENTKEKIITCPLDECGLKTNIWDKLRHIQKLKKDFKSGKEELSKGDVLLAKDIFKDVIEEWDRMILRPYRELMSVEDAYVKTLYCERGDRERMLVEGNQMGKIVGYKKPVNVMEPSPFENPDSDITSKMVEINKTS